MNFHFYNYIIKPTENVHHIQLQFYKILTQLQRMRIQMFKMNNNNNNILTKCIQYK